jgi:hypothetical protein
VLIELRSRTNLYMVPSNGETLDERVQRWLGTRRRYLVPALPTQIPLWAFFYGCIFQWDFFPWGWLAFTSGFVASLTAAFDPGPWLKHRNPDPAEFLWETEIEPWAGTPPLVVTTHGQLRQVVRGRPASTWPNPVGTERRR